MDDALPVDRRYIDTPLKSLWAIGDALQGAAWKAVTAIRTCPLELPLRNQVRIELATH
jgi:hypothetical protein